MKERALFARNFKFSTIEQEGNWSRNVPRFVCGIVTAGDAPV